MEKLKKIILIDDDEVSNFIVKRTIEQLEAGIEVDILEPFDALERLSKGEMTHLENIMILLDINMPDISGWDFLEKLANVAPNLMDKLLICLLTSSVMDADMAKSANYDIVKSYLVKPLFEDKLLEVASKYFELDIDN